MKKHTMDSSRRRMTAFTYAALIAGSVIMIFPFVWMILTSFKTVPESMAVPPTILPKQVTAANFQEALTSLPFLKLYLNTTLMILFRVICDARRASHWPR